MAKRLEMSYQLLQNYIGKTPTKRIGDKIARRAEETFGLPHGWMDQMHDAKAPLPDMGDAPWPFSIERGRFDRLPAREKLRAERALRDIIETWEAAELELDKVKAG